MGYIFTKLDNESLLSFIHEEYDYVNWDTTSLENDDEHIAVWGWCSNGTYEVALAILQERTEEIQTERVVIDLDNNGRIIEGDNLDDIDEDEILEEDNETRWYVKVMNEVEGPFIQPPDSFIQNRPSLTLEAKRSLKESKEREKFFDELELLESDKFNEGIINSAVSCGNEQIFIWTTKGNYYIPESAYDMDLAMIGAITVESLRRSNIPMIPTIEERPHSVYGDKK